jgi:hypothetical protein
MHCQSSSGRDFCPRVPNVTLRKLRLPSTSIKNYHPAPWHPHRRPPKRSTVCSRPTYIS